MTRQNAFLRDAVQDLAHLENISDELSLVLLVSERTLYVLQNLAIAEVANPARYAIEFFNQGYVPVQEGDALFTLFKSVRDEAQLEILEVGMLGDFYGIQDAFYAEASDTSAGGTVTLNIGPIAEGEKWQVEVIQLLNEDSSSYSQNVSAVSTVGVARVAQWGTTEANTRNLWNGRLTLAGGDRVRAVFTGTTAGDNVSLAIWAVILS